MTIEQELIRSLKQTIEVQKELIKELKKQIENPIFPNTIGNFEEIPEQFRTPYPYPINLNQTITPIHGGQISSTRSGCSCDNCVTSLDNLNTNIASEEKYF